MIFPVFRKKTDGTYDLVGIWENLTAAIQYVNDNATPTNELHWEPWPLDAPFPKAGDDLE
jgi:hypothetical protein